MSNTKKVELTAEERLWIVQRIDDRILSASHVLGEGYTDQFLAPYNTRDEIERVHAERREEIKQLKELKAKIL